jgi:hypothetical protein
MSVTYGQTQTPYITITGRLKTTNRAINSLSSPLSEEYSAHVRLPLAPPIDIFENSVLVCIRSLQLIVFSYLVLSYQTIIYRL